MKQFFTESCGASLHAHTQAACDDNNPHQFRHRQGGNAHRTSCGKRSFSTTSVFVSLMLMYWSTECSVPRMARSFLSSTTTTLPCSVWKNV
jgi:hypothetical protein